MTYPLTTTLNRIWACDPCDEGRQRALLAAGKNAPDNEPITYQQIVEAVGLDDALWCCQAEPQYDREWRLFTVWCARQVQHLMTDERSIAVLDVAERYAHGEATDEQLDAAGAAAWTAAGDAAGNAAWAAARDAGGAAARAAARDAVGNAAWAAAWAAAGAAAGAAAWNSAWAAAWTAAGDAAGNAAWAAARDAQRDAFIRLVTTGELPEIVRQEVEQ